MRQYRNHMLYISVGFQDQKHFSQIHIQGATKLKFWLNGQFLQLLLPLQTDAKLMYYCKPKYLNIYSIIRNPIGCPSVQANKS